LLGSPMTRSLDSLKTTPSYIAQQAKDAGFLMKAYYPDLRFRWPSLAGLFQERDERIAEGLKGTSVRSRELTGYVLQDLERRRDDNARFFAWVHYLEPHAPYVSSSEGEPVPLLAPGREKGYAAEVRRTDIDVAYLVDRARALGFDRDAAIVITGDHAESFEHGVFYHGHSLFAAEIQVPLMVWLFDATGAPQPLKLPDGTTERDVSALLARLIGVSPPPGQSKISAQISQQIEGNELHQFAIVDGRWKLIYHWLERYEELYDLELDPNETRNVIENHRAEAPQLRLRLGEELTPLFGRAAALVGQASD
jgi:arylsulfatase A-like enzyme